MTTKNAIHALTTAEIARQIAPYSERLKQIKNERAALYAHALKNGGVGDTPVIDADERAAREHAKNLLNGAAPEFLSLPPEITRDRILLREQRALELVLKILADKDLAARATEAVAWAEEHGDKWRALAREIVLAAVRLGALERVTTELLQQCPDPFAVRLPMGNIIGGRAISETPLSELIAAALAEGVVTSAEIKRAEKC
jgi:hypothetical protein